MAGIFGRSKKEKEELERNIQARRDWLEREKTRKELDLIDANLDRVEEDVRLEKLKKRNPPEPPPRWW